MIKAIRMAMKYGTVLTEVFEVVVNIDGAIRADGKISRKERNKLTSQFGAVIRSIQQAH